MPAASLEVSPREEAVVAVADRVLRPTWQLLRAHAPLLAKVVHAAQNGRILVGRPFRAVLPGHAAAAAAIAVLSQGKCRRPQASVVVILCQRGHPLFWLCLLLQTRPAVSYGGRRPARDSARCLLPAVAVCRDDRTDELVLAAVPAPALAPLPDQRQGPWLILTSTAGLLTAKREPFAAVSTFRPAAAQRRQVAVCVREVVQLLERPHQNSLLSGVGVISVIKGLRDNSLRLLRYRREDASTHLRLC